MKESQRSAAVPGATRRMSRRKRKVQAVMVEEEEEEEEEDRGDETELVALENRSSFVESKREQGSRGREAVAGAKHHGVAAFSMRMSESCCFLALPVDALEHVFKHLPLPFVLPCASVCRSWERILGVDRIRRDWCCKTSKAAIWLKSEHHAVHVCAPDASTPSLESGNIIAPDYLLSVEVQLIASAHGLLCFLCKTNSHDQILVYNPAARIYKILPPMIHIEHVEAVGMVSNRLAESYQVLVTGSAGRPPRRPYYDGIVALYDSKTHQWQELSIFPTDSYVLKLERITWWNGRFYWLTRPRGGQNVLQLLVYNMEERKWEKSCIKGIERFDIGPWFIGPQLDLDMFVWRGRLHLKKLQDQSLWCFGGRHNEWRAVDEEKEIKCEKLLICAHKGEAGLQVCIQDPEHQDDIFKDESSRLLLSNRKYVRENFTAAFHCQEKVFPYIPCLSTKV